MLGGVESTDCVLVPKLEYAVCNEPLHIGFPPHRIHQIPIAESSEVIRYVLGKSVGILDRVASILDLGPEILRTQVVVDSPANIVKQLGNDRRMVVEDVVMKPCIEVVENTQRLG